MTAVAQITAKVNPSLKKSFMQRAKYYDLPASGVLSLLMRMFADGEIKPSFKMLQDDRNRAEEDMIPVNEPIGNVIASLKHML